MHGISSEKVLARRATSRALRGSGAHAGTGVTTSTMATVGLLLALGACAAPSPVQSASNALPANRGSMATGLGPVVAGRPTSDPAAAIAQRQMAQVNRPPQTPPSRPAQCRSPPEPSTGCVYKGRHYAGASETICINGYLARCLGVEFDMMRQRGGWLVSRHITCSEHK
jgi:hypothetical protein